MTTNWQKAPASHMLEAIFKAKMLNKWSVSELAELSKIPKLIRHKKLSICLTKKREKGVAS